MEAIKNIEPLFDRVLVAPIKSTTKTSSGIYIPDTAQERTQEGHVVAVGPGKEDEPMVVKVGDRVMYRGGREITLDEKKYLMMYQSDIYATVK